MIFSSHLKMPYMRWVFAQLISLSYFYILNIYYFCIDACYFTALQRPRSRGMWSQSSRELTVLIDSLKIQNSCRSLISSILSLLYFVTFEEISYSRRETVELTLQTQLMFWLYYFCLLSDMFMLALKLEKLFTIWEPASSAMLLGLLYMISLERQGPLSLPRLSSQSTPCREGCLFSLSNIVEEYNIRLVSSGNKIRVIDH